MCLLFGQVPVWIHANIFMTSSENQQCQVPLHMAKDSNLTARDDYLIQGNRERGFARWFQPLCYSSICFILALSKRWFKRLQGKVKCLYDHPMVKAQNEPLPVVA